MQMIRWVDGLVEAFRPGVGECSGFGSEACLTESPCLANGGATDLRRRTQPGVDEFDRQCHRCLGDRGS